MKNHKNTSKQCLNEHVDCEQQSETNPSESGQVHPASVSGKPVIYQTSPERLVPASTDRLPYFITPSENGVHRIKKPGEES